MGRTWTIRETIQYEYGRYQHVYTLRVYATDLADVIFVKKNYLKSQNHT